MMCQISIVSCIDSNFVLPLCVTIHSVASNNINSNIIYYVLGIDLTDSDKENLRQLEKKSTNLNVKVIDATVDSFDSDIKKFLASSLELEGNGRLSFATYIRLFILEYLPGNVSKILYLDADVICLNSLEKLWETDITNYALAAVEDISSEINKARLNLEKYINSGVLLINLSYWRRINATNLFVNFIRKNSRIIKLHDQDILNLCFKDKILTLSCSYNYQLLGENYSSQSDARASALVHFIAFHKPWVKGNSCPLKTEWISYYEACFGHKWHYVKSFSTKDRTVLFIRRLSLFICPIGSFRRKVIKKIFPSWILKQFKQKIV